MAMPTNMLLYPKQAPCKALETLFLSLDSHQECHLNIHESSKHLRLSRDILGKNSNAFEKLFLSLDP